MIARKQFSGEATLRHHITSPTFLRKRDYQYRECEKSKHDSILVNERVSNTNSYMFIHIYLCYYEDMI